MSEKAIIFQKEAKQNVKIQLNGVWKGETRENNGVTLNAMYIANTTVVELDKSHFVVGCGVLFTRMMRPRKNRDTDRCSTVTITAIVPFIDFSIPLSRPA